HLAADLRDRSLEALVRIGRIVEDTELADLARDVVDVGRPVAVLDANQHDQAAADARRVVARGDTGRGHSLDDRSQEMAGTRALSSDGGFSRVSSRCRGATLPSALSIDCLTPGCSRSSSINSRLAR